MSELETMSINSYRGSYTVEFIDDHLRVLDGCYEPGDVIFADAGVCRAFPKLSDFVTTRSHLLITSDESVKSYEGVIPFIEFLVRAEFTKGNKLIALGGGITQDVTAFVASIFHRGAKWAFFPTNLLTQCDSCIGSKTSINFRQFKNQLGGFYPPSQIFIDTGFLEGIGRREVLSGLGEMLHYFLVSGEEDFVRVESAFESAAQDRRVLTRLIHRSLQIKKQMVEIDEFDKGPRNVFNYGHSFGHALEAVSGFSVPHGIAVAFGMDLANVLSADLGQIEMALRNRVRKTLHKVFGETELPRFELSEYVSALKRDKKNSGSQVNVILTSGIGSMQKQALPMTPAVLSRLEEFYANRLYEADL